MQRAKQHRGLGVRPLADAALAGAWAWHPSHGRTFRSDSESESVHKEPASIVLQLRLGPGFRLAGEEMPHHVRADVSGATPRLELSSWLYFQ